VQQTRNRRASAQKRTHTGLRAPHARSHADGRGGVTRKQSSREYSGPKCLSTNARRAYRGGHVTIAARRKTNRQNTGGTPQPSNPTPWIPPNANTLQYPNPQTLDTPGPAMGAKRNGEGQGGGARRRYIRRSRCRNGARRALAAVAAAAATAGIGTPAAYMLAGSGDRGVWHGRVVERTGTWHGTTSDDKAAGRGGRRELATGRGDHHRSRNLRIAGKRIRRRAGQIRT
jgi:hypothetical protein